MGRNGHQGEVGAATEAVTKRARAAGVMVAGVREAAMEVTVKVMVVATAAAAEMVNPMAAAGATSGERDTVQATVETEGEREVATEAMEDMVKAMAVATVAVAAAREDGATVKEMVVDITDKGATQDWTTLQCKLIQTFTIALILP